ncbi:putative transcription factor B3-Domain family [Helianthus anomalus]
MNGSLLNDQFLLNFNRMRSWVLRYKRANEDITITDGWKTIVDDLGLKHGFLLDEFMLTAFNVDFVIVFKSRKRYLTFQLLLFKCRVGFLR